MAFQKILVAIDQSHQADEVFSQALDLTQKEGGQLLVFNCCQWTPAVRSHYFLETGLLASTDMHYPVSCLHPDMLQDELEHTHRWLQAYEKQATTQGVSTQSALRLGNPSSAICEVAQTWGADLIIVGRRDHSKFPEMLLGSVSNYVLHHAPCSVLVVQGNGLAMDDLSAPAQAGEVRVSEG